MGTLRGTGVICVFVCLFLLGCAGTSGTGATANCSAITSGQLTHYDQYSQQFLEAATTLPSDNSQGNIIWNTRYYMESLLDAYEATGNMKYIQAFLTTGNAVMSEVQSLNLPNVADPSAPGGDTENAPTITVTGWPTQLNSFSEAVAIPTPDGQTSLYAQNLDPTDPNGPIYFQVTQQQGGGLTLAWVGSSATLESQTVTSESDLAAAAAAPLVEGQSYGRIKPTGAGLPAPGTYQVNTPIWTVWHEHTGGILLPFARFLLLAKQNPNLAATNTVTNWQAQVLKIAAGYTDEFVSDGNGGLLFQNPTWLPNGIAATDAAADYIAVEATMRAFLYELTGDASQLAIAQGLVTHQKNYHWQTNSTGWLLLKSWPCFIPWTTGASAPYGSVWSAYTFDPTTPAPVEDGATMVDLLHEANVLGLETQLGIPASIYAANQATLLKYLFANPDDASRASGMLRGAYPTASSTANDAPSTSQYSWSSAWYVAPETASTDYVNANWQWMLRFNQNPQGGPVGYFLRAWAMSEAAEAAVCKAR